MSSNLVGKIIWLNNSNIVYDKDYINIEENNNNDNNNNDNNNDNNNENNNNNKILTPFDNIYLYGNVKEYDKVYDNYLIETNNILKNKIEKIKYQVNEDIKNVKEFNPNILININNLDELKEDEISAEEINYFFIKKYENKQNFYNLNNKILIQLTNYYENNKDLNYKKLYKFINKILKEKNNNSLIFIGKQNSNKINCFRESLNYILNKNSKYEKIKTIFENCFNVYKLFNENIKNKSKNNLLIQIEFNKSNNNINLIRFIPNSLISLSKNNLFKIIYIIINIFSNENNDEIIEKFNIKTIQKEKLKFLNIYDFNKDLEIEYKFLYNLFKNIQLNESEIKLLINILLSLIFLLNNEIKNFCSLLNINNFNENLIIENKFHLIKFIYFKIFEWLIKKINSNLNFNNNNNKNSEIYILNLYYNKGFEYLLEDNLNTMINNYSYEKIFNLFIKKNINDVFDEYDSENIITNKINFDVIDNKEIINLFEKEIFEIINKFNENKKIIENINKINNNSFGNLENNFLLIYHSFGEVFYDFLNIFEENILINKNIIEILQKSENKYFLKIILNNKNNNNNNNNNELTLINYYLKQIKENFNILSYSNCNFIFSFEYNKSLFKQILSSNICEIYNFNNEKYVYILTQEKFLNIMKILSNNIKNNLENKKDLINEKNTIKIKGLIMSLIPILYEENEEFLNVFENDEIQIGISKIFINKKGMKILLKSLNKINKIKLIQKCFKNYKKNKFNLKKENSFFGSNFETNNNEILDENEEKKELKNENFEKENFNLSMKNKINELLKKIEEISKEKNELLKENEKLKNNNEILKINNLNLIKTSKFKKKRTNSIIPEVDDLKESDENEKLKEKIKELENKIKDLEKNNIYFNYLQKENNRINKLNEELQKNINKENKIKEENKKILNEFKKKLGIEINFDENNKIQILNLKDNLKNLVQNEKNLKEIIKHKNKIISNKKKELNYFSNLIILKNLFIQVQKNINNNKNYDLNNLIQKKIENLKENEKNIIKKLNLLFNEDEQLFLNDKDTNSSEEEENENENFENNLNINKINLMNIESEEKNNENEDEFEFIKKY